MNRTNIIIGASFLALVVLFAFQIRWMTDSRNLIEEQFNHKVSMAMCYAVDILKTETGVTSSTSPVSDNCGPLKEVDAGYQFEMKEKVEVATVERALGIALDFYSVKMDYTVDIQNNCEISLGAIPKYSCTLNPLKKNESNHMIVSFPGKEQYIFGKMKFMFFSSIIILAFLSLVFLLASYTMLRQRRMQRMNKDFFNNMAHEFRTPLANISLAGSLLSKKLQDPKELKYLEVLRGESKKLAKQVDSILQLSKMENGEYELNREQLCLKSLIQHVIDSMELQIKEKDALINFEIVGDTVGVIGDKFHLGNAFRNLLENALKYSNKEPIIQITLKRDRNGILIHFQDNGIGIAKKDQKDIFEKYYRVNHGNVHNEKGFGLGLAYVKMIIERHKGMINIFSDLNKGTRFDLFLPVN